MLREPATGLPPHVVASYRLHFLPGIQDPAVDLRLPFHVVKFLQQEISPVHRLCEHMGALFVNQAIYPIAYSLPYLGYLGHTGVDPSLILGPGPFLGAAGFILFHHQPDNLARPTRQDLHLAKRVRDVGEVIRLRLLDVILTGRDNHWTSIKTEGRLELPALGDPGSSDRRSCVRPKYRNPDDPDQTWSGRGRMALWLREKIEAGGKLEDFLVDE